MKPVSAKTLTRPMALLAVLWVRNSSPKKPPRVISQCSGGMLITIAMPAVRALNASVIASRV